MKRTYFPLSIIIIFSLFSVMFVVVISAAYFRRSGNTHVEISHMHQLRHDSIYKSNQTATK